MGSLNAPQKVKTLAPEGAHPAMLYSIIDLGTKMDSFQGATPQPKHEIQLTWELLDTQMEDGKPYVISKAFTVTPSQYEAGAFYFAKTSNINKLLQKWTGKDDKVCSKTYTLTDMVHNNTPCTVTVEHIEGRKDASKVYDVIESVKPYKGKEKLKPFNPRLILDLDDKLPEGIAPWIVTRRADCLEFNGGVPARVRDEETRERSTPPPDNGIGYEDFDLR